MGASGLFYCRKTALAADQVGSFTQLHVGAAGVIVVPAVPEGHGVEDKVIVIAVGVDVGSDDDFVLAAPDPVGEFDTDFVCQLGSDFSGREALISVEDQVAASFGKALFCHVHLVISHARDAVQACDQLAVHSFFFVHDI